MNHTLEYGKVLLGHYLATYMDRLPANLAQSSGMLMQRCPRRQSPPSQRVRITGINFLHPIDHNKTKFFTI